MIDLAFLMLLFYNTKWLSFLVVGSFPYLILVKFQTLYFTNQNVFAEIVLMFRV